MSFRDIAKLLIQKEIEKSDLEKEIAELRIQLITESKTR